MTPDYYHIIQSQNDEWLTRNDTTAEMAECEGLAVHYNVPVDELDEFCIHHDSWHELPVK